MNDVVHLIFVILHVLGAMIIVGGSLVSLVVLHRKPVSVDNLTLLENFWKIGGPAMGLQVVTGIGLAALEWHAFAANPIFWAKMVAFVGAEAVGIGVIGKKMKGKQFADAARWAWISFSLFAVIVILGVILAETHH